MYLLSMCALMAWDKCAHSVSSNRATCKRPAKHPLDEPLMPNFNNTDFLTPQI